MTKPPNHRHAECNRCDNCNYAEWVRKYALYVNSCKKHDVPTRGNQVCDDWVMEQ